MVPSMVKLFMELLGCVWDPLEEGGAGWSQSGKERRRGEKEITCVVRGQTNV